MEGTSVNQKHTALESILNHQAESLIELCRLHEALTRHNYLGFLWKNYLTLGKAIVILDPASAQAIPDELLTLVDYITPNETDLAMLNGVTREGSLDCNDASQMARRSLSRGAKRVIVKLGSQGALLVGEDYEHFWPAVSVVAVDTAAAGDAFNAALAVALAAGKSEIEAGEFAAVAAAYSVTRKGAQPSMPTLQEIENLLRKESLQKSQTEQKAQS